MRAQDEAPARQRLACSVAGFRDVTPDTRVLWLMPPPGHRLRFLAGQYAQLRFADHPPRDYSMASRPDQTRLEFHVAHTGGEGASHHVRHRLRIAETVGLEGPFGENHLRTGHRGPMLCVAAGSGLAPMKSIVETALRRGMRYPVHLYFAARERTDVYLEAHFRRLAAAHENLRYVPLLSPGAGDGSYREGEPGDAIADDFDSLSQVLAYVAGPPALVDEVEARLRALGMAPEQVRADAFRDAQPPGETP